MPCSLILVAVEPDTTSSSTVGGCSCRLRALLQHSAPEQFDQAGLFVVLDTQHWVKAAIETSDGSLQLRAVVTWPRSDWSVAPVPQWAGREVTVRASLSEGALTIRAR